MDRKNIEDGDIVVFRHDGRDCIAVMRDETVFYVALNYDHVNEEFFFGDIMADESIREPNQYEQVVGEYIREKNYEEIERMRIPHLEEDELYIRENKTKVRIPILPYVNGTKKMRFDFPLFHANDNGHSLSKMYDGFVTSILQLTNSNAFAPYILSKEYIAEMCKQAQQFGKATIDKIHDSFGGKCSKGYIVTPREEGGVDTLIYTYEASTKKLSLTLMADDMMLALVNYVGSRANYYWSENIGSSKNREETLRAMETQLYWFLCMERKANIILKDEFEGKKDESYQSVGEAMAASIHSEYYLRDATWYTTIFVDKDLYVNAHKSHRWKRDKSTGALYLAPVDVRSYTKKGYHREAKVNQ